MRVKGVALRNVFRCMAHFKSANNHGFASVRERSVDFFVVTPECDVCFSLMDEIDLDKKFG